MIKSTLMGIIGASFGVFLIGGIYPFMAASHADDLEMKVKALRTISISATCILLATITLVFMQ